MRTRIRVGGGLGLLLLLVVIGAVILRSGQGTKPDITVDASIPLATIPIAAVGLNAAAWDSHLLDPAVPSLLRQAGVTALRFPGGSTADTYHWQNNAVRTDSGGSAHMSTSFDEFVGVAHRAGALPIVTVNYGSNASGTGGGDPGEAAAWVRYANVTRRYGVKYWEIGNEVYGNGTYGKAKAWETDLHQNKGPAAYATNVLTFIHAMKAADSSIQVGVVLTAPGNWPDGQSPDWNSTVLSSTCSQIDFVIMHWYAQQPGAESDAGLLSASSGIAEMVKKLRSAIGRYCGARAGEIQIMVTETNSVAFNPGKQTVSLVNGLFLADEYASWLERGVANVDWWALHNSTTTGTNNASSLYGTANFGDYGVLSAGVSSGGVTEPPAETPFPPYYGLSMLTHVGKAGDRFITVGTSQDHIAVHAVKQTDGNLALLLINKDPDTTYTLKATLRGYHPASTATLYSFGKDSTSISATTASGYGDTFTQSIAPYSLTAVVLRPR